MSFISREVLPGVYHIEDALGVCMTLLRGEREALLVDAGFGLEDAAAFAASLTEKPIRLVLSHGHYDHALGACWFPEAEIFDEDKPLAEAHAGTFWRQRALDEAVRQGIGADAEYLVHSLPPLKSLREETIELGGLSVRVLRCPGHTPGSAVFYVPERELLLTGDDWNPCTWLFFPEALPAAEYRKNMRKLLELPFRRVLCPHRTELYDRSMLEDFLTGLTDEALRAAKPVDTGAWLGVRTAEAEPAPGQCLVFDAAKFAGKEET